MLRWGGVSLILYGYLLGRCHAQEVSTRPVCLPVSSISYPAYEWGAELPVTVKVDFDVASDGRFENVQASEDSDDIAVSLKSLFAKSQAPLECSGKHLSVRLEFRIEGEPAKETNVAASFNGPEVIQIVASPPGELCKKPPGSHYEARSCYGRGTTLSAAGRYEEAIECLTRALVWAPDPDVYIERGIAYRKSQRLNEAISDYGEAIRLSPSNADAYFDRGNARQYAGAFDLAIEDYSKALELKPGLVQAHGNRGNAYMEEQRFALAVEDFSAVLQHDARDVKALNNRAVAYLSQGQIAQSIEDLGRALEIEPGSPVALSTRAVAYEAQGRYEAAIDDLRMALVTNPSYVSAHIGLARIYERQKDLRAARLELDKVIELAPNLPSAYEDRARIRGALGDSAGAEADRNAAGALPAPLSSFIKDK
jgi:tetratricopeptide (TPR) repeat protein